MPNNPQANPQEKRQDQSRQSPDRSQAERSPAREKDDTSSPSRQS